MSGDGSVLAELKQIIEGKPRCGITSEIIHRATDKRIGYRGVLQLNPEDRQDFCFTGFSYLPDPPETIGVMRKIQQIALESNGFESVNELAGALFDAGEPVMAAQRKNLDDPDLEELDMDDADVGFTLLEGGEDEAWEKLYNRIVREPSQT